MVESSKHVSTFLKSSIQNKDASSGPYVCQRINEQVEAQRPHHSSEGSLNGQIAASRTIMVPSTSSVAAGASDKPSKEKTCLRQQKWLLLLCHARKCAAPEGKCPERNCPKVQFFLKEPSGSCIQDFVPMLNLSNFFGGGSRENAGAIVNQLRSDMERLQEEIRAQLLEIESIKMEYVNAQLECTAADERAQILTSEVIELEEKYRMPEAYDDQDGGVNQEKRFATILQRYSHIWTDTDNNRTGMLPFVFDGSFGYGHWEVVCSNVIRAHYLSGRTALHFAVVNGHVRCIRLVVADFVPSVPHEVISSQASAEGGPTTNTSTTRSNSLQLRDPVSTFNGSDGVMVMVMLLLEGGGVLLKMTW